MISNWLIILYCLPSIIGGVIYLKMNRKNTTRLKVLTMLFFTGSHLMLLVFGLVGFVIKIQLFLLVLILVIVIISRICNGVVLYGKNNWHHYMVTGGILATIFILRLYGM